MGVQVIQCMYEVQCHVLELTREFQCPLMSLNADLYMFDLPHGLIPALSLEDRVRHSADGNYILCDLFKRVNLLNVFPKMDLRSFSLLGALANNNVRNDYEQFQILWEISEMLEDRKRCAQCGYKRLTRYCGDTSNRIVRILSNLCCRSYEDSVDYLCGLAQPDRQEEARGSFEANLAYYDPPPAVQIEDELRRICRKGFFIQLESASQDRDELERQFNLNMRKITDWLLRGLEKSVITKVLLALIADKYKFFSYYLEDESLACTGAIQMRPLRVMKSLLCTCANTYSKSKVATRVNQTVQIVDLEPLEELEKFGRLDYLIYDLPELSRTEARAILLATFHCSVDEFERQVELHGCQLDDDVVQEYFIVKLLLYAIDIEFPMLKLSADFKLATLSAFLYYLGDKCKLSAEYATSMVGSIDRHGYRWRTPLKLMAAYNRRTMHRIGQLQLTIESFNNLNGLLGDPMRRVRPEDWLNSCLIYNLAEDPEVLGDKIPAEVCGPFELA